MEIWAQSKTQPQRSSQDLAIDLGTATGSIWSDGKFGTITVEDPQTKQPREITHIRTLVARKQPIVAEKEGMLNLLLSWLERRDRRIKEQKQAAAKVLLVPDDNEKTVEAVGHAAFECWGRDPNLSIKQAVKHGNVGDVQAYRSVFRHMIRTRHPDFKWNFEDVDPKPRILIGVPHNATTRHLKFVQGVISDNLKASPYLVWEQVAAAVGMRLKNGKGLDFRGVKSVGLADGGGGTFDFAVMNNGRVVHMRSYDHAGDDLDAAIVNHLLRKHNIDIGYRTAIAIKEGIGSAIAIPGEDQEELHEVTGASFKTEMPAKTFVTRKEIRTCLMPVLKAIAGDFKRFMRGLQAYGEVHADIKENGFYLTGGTTQLPGLDRFLKKETNLRIQQAENAMSSVIDGLILMLADDELLQLGLADIAA